MLASLGRPGLAAGEYRRGTMGIDRASSAARSDDTPASGTGDNGPGAERAAQTQVSTSDTRSQPRAETRTRGQYADAMRAGGSPMSRDSSRDTGETTEGEPPGQVGRQARQAEDHGRAGHQPETITFGGKEIEHGINAGQGVEAFLTLAIVGAAAVHKLHERWRRAWDH
jgi:hypothetical protein